MLNPGFQGTRYQLTWEALWWSDHVLIWTMMAVWNHLWSASQEVEAQNWRAGTSGPVHDFSAMPTDALTPQCSCSVQKVPWSHSYLHWQHQTDCSRPSGEHVSIYSDQSFMCIKNTSGKPLVAHHQILPPGLPFPDSVVSLQHTKTFERYLRTWFIWCQGHH